MVRRRKINRKLIRRQILILTGGLLFAVLALFAAAKSIPPPPESQPNELELRESMSEAADDYLLAKDTAERQAAARRLKSIRHGDGDNYGRNIQAISFLRILLFITIVVLAWKITILLIRLAKKPGKVHQT